MDRLPSNQIQRILDHGHLLTVHDPEQESSELDTVILKALVKGKAAGERCVVEIREVFSTSQLHGEKERERERDGGHFELFICCESCMLCVCVCACQLVKAKVRKHKTSWTS